MILAIVAAWPAAACEPQIDGDISVTILVGDSGGPRAGEPFSIAWTAEALDCDGPLYLIVAIPERVRFKGEGFVALAPGEPAPFDIGFGSERMRLAIPLHIDETRNGIAEVTPYLNGDFEIDWRLTAPHAQPATLASGGMSLSIGVGRPKIVVQDVHATDTPISVTTSPDGAFVASAFDGHFRVIDAETDALVLAAEGYGPTFSPTSRFVHWFGEAISQLRVADLHSESIIVDLDPEAAGGRGFSVSGVEWSPGDTFMLVLYSGNGGMGVKQMLSDRSLRYHADGCGACGPAEYGVVRVDVDNAAVELGEGAFRVGYSLAFDRQLYTYDWEDDGIRRTDLWHEHFISPTPTDVEPGEAGWDLNGPREATIDYHEGLAALDAVPWVRQRIADIEAEERARRAYEEGRAVEAGTEVPPEPGGEITLAKPGGDTATQRGAAALAASGRINRQTRIARRLAALGIRYRHPAPMKFDRVEFEYVKEGETFADDYRVKTGQTALQNGLVSKERAQQIDDAVAGLTDAYRPCTGPMRAFNAEAQVWSWRYRGGLRQIIQYYCYVSTGGIPEGIAFLVEADDSGARYRLIGQTLTEEVERLGSYEVGTRARGEDDQPELVDMAFYDELRVFRPDERHVGLLNSRGAFALVGAANGRPVFHVPIVDDAANVETITVTEDGRNLVQVNDDGQFFVRRVANGDKVLAGRFVDDEVVVYDDGYNFESTPDGARHVHLKFPGDRNLYELDQFAGTLRSEGMVMRRLERDAQRREEVRVPGIPPRLSVTAEPPPPGTSRLSLKIAAHGDVALNMLDIFRDGRLMDTVALDSEEVATTRDVPLAPETRAVSIRVTDARGLRSLTRSLPIDRAERGIARGTLHLVAVGTDRYDDPGINRLHFAVSDAQRFARTVETKAGGYYADVRTEVIADAAGLSHLLPKRLDSVRKRMGPEDSLFLLIAGHGITDGSGFHLADRATRLDDLTGTSISMDQIAAALDAVPGRVFVFLDACHSGAAGAATNDAAVDTLLGSAQAPMAVLSASKGRQASLEGAQYSGGVFTSALTQIFSERAAHDFNGNGTVDFDELYGALKRQVVVQTDGLQTPWIARSGLEGVTPVF